MNYLNPKNLFQQDDQRRADADRRLNETSFHELTSYALSQYALTRPTQEKLNGAIEFLSVLMTFGEKPQETAKMPDKTLDYDTVKPSYHQESKNKS